MLQKARGSYVSAEEFNALVDEVNRLANILGNPGPGLELKAGRTLSIGTRWISPEASTGITCTAGTDSDTWIRTTNRPNITGLDFYVISDIKAGAVVGGVAPMLILGRRIWLDSVGQLYRIDAEATIFTNTSMQFLLNPGPTELALVKL